MRLRFLPLVLLVMVPSVVFATADGAWLRRVPDEDRARRNPVAGQAGAVKVGEGLFHENCARCHGVDADGRTTRPSLRSARIRGASDGSLLWMLRNGNPYKGMPPAQALSEPQKWQVIAYLRSLPASKK